MKMIGAIILLLPFIIMFFITVKIAGFKDAVIIWIITAVIVALIGIGIILLRG